MVCVEIATVGERMQSILELDVGQTAGASWPALQAALCAVLLSREDQCSRRRVTRGSVSRR
jgi:hypothetical protein